MPDRASPTIEFQLYASSPPRCPNLISSTSSVSNLLTLAPSLLFAAAHLTVVYLNPGPLFDAVMIPSRLCPSPSPALARKSLSRARVFAITGISQLVSCFARSQSCVAYSIFFVVLSRICEMGSTASTAPVGPTLPAAARLRRGASSIRRPPRAACSFRSRRSLARETARRRSRRRRRRPRGARRRRRRTRGI